MFVDSLCCQASPRGQELAGLPTCAIRDTLLVDVCGGERIGLLLGVAVYQRRRAFPSEFLSQTVPGRYVRLLRRGCWL